MDKVNNKIYRNQEGFHEILNKIVNNGVLVESNIEEGLRVYLLDNKQYNVYEDLEYGVYKYIIIK